MPHAFWGNPQTLFHQPNYYRSTCRSIWYVVCRSTCRSTLMLYVQFCSIKKQDMSIKYIDEHMFVIISLPCTQTRVHRWMTPALWQLNNVVLRILEQGPLLSCRITDCAQITLFSLAYLYANYMTAFWTANLVIGNQLVANSKRSCGSLFLLG